MPAIVNPWNLGSDEPTKVLTVKSVKRGMNKAQSKSLLERRRQRAAGLNTADLRRMEFIPWSRVRQALEGLNPNIWFEDMPQELVGICLRTPSPLAIRRWEATGLSWQDQQHVKALQGSDIGPSRKIVAASKGLIAPFKDLVSWSERPGLISRSLKNILKRCVIHGAFTWEEAELAFGMTFRGRKTEPVFLPAPIDLWGRNPERAIAESMNPAEAPQKRRVIRPGEERKYEYKGIKIA